VQLLGQQPSLTVPLHTAVLQTLASRASPAPVSAPMLTSPRASEPASGAPSSGPTSAYVDRCVVVAAAVSIEDTTVVASRFHFDPSATAIRIDVAAMGAMSSGW